MTIAIKQARAENKNRSSSDGNLRPTNVRFGSKADVTLLNLDVRFTPESGHSRTRSGCLLWAISGHQFGLDREDSRT
jgi:hypothetical protein